MTYGKHYELVEEFQRAFNQPMALDVVSFNRDRRALRNKLLKEEEAELLDAMADIAYIIIGTAVEYSGYERNALSQYAKIRDLSKSYFGSYRQFDEAFKRVHESNMSKLVNGKPVINGHNGVYDESKPMGKVLKPDTYIPVDLSDLV